MFSLVIGLLSFGVAQAGPLPADPQPVVFAFQGSGAGTGHRLTGWLAFDPTLRAPVTSGPESAIYDFPAEPETRIAFVITDAATGVVSDTHIAANFPMRIECVDAADSLFRISTKTGDMDINFVVRGPLGSLFQALEIPHAAPIGTSGTWKAVRLRAGSWSGDAFAYVTGDETAALLALLEEANAQIATLTTELGDANGELKKLQFDYKISQVELAKANAHIEELTTELNAANAQVTQLTTDLGAARGELKKLQFDYKISQVELAKANARIEELIGELSTANAQVAQLTTDLMSAKEEVVSLNAQLGAISQELRVLELNFAKTEAKLNQALAQNEALTAQLAAAQAQVTQLSTDLAAANALATQLTGERDAALLELKGLRKDYQLARVQLAKSEAQIERLMTDLDAANAQIASLTSSLTAAQADAAQLRSALAAAQAQNAELRAALASQSTSLNRIGAAIAAANKEPAFAIPGANPGDQLANLAAALERLNPGQLKTLRTELAGKK